MARTIIRYNPKLKEYARQLRQNMTLAEVLLWKRLKGKKVRGYDFNRQRPIDEYVVDFYCKELQLAIEVDGYTHNFKEAADQKRQQKLERLGVRFLRFWDCEVKENLSEVVSLIERWIDENEEPTPPCGHPSKEGN